MFSARNAIDKQNGRLRVIAAREQGALDGLIAGACGTGANGSFGAGELSVNSLGTIKCGYGRCLRLGRDSPCNGMNNGSKPSAWRIEEKGPEVTGKSCHQRVC